VVVDALSTPELSNWHNEPLKKDAIDDTLNYLTFLRERVKKMKGEDESIDKIRQAPAEKPFKDYKMYNEFYNTKIFRVALEALISGCALVVSDLGGQKEAVIEGFNSYIFERGNPEALKEKLSLALENWETFSKNSQKLYWEKFSAQRTINKIPKIFTR